MRYLVVLKEWGGSHSERAKTKVAAIYAVKCCANAYRTAVRWLINSQHQGDINSWLACCFRQNRPLGVDLVKHFHWFAIPNLCELAASSELMAFFSWKNSSFFEEILWNFPFLRTFVRNHYFCCLWEPSLWKWMKIVKKCKWFQQEQNLWILDISGLSRLSRCLIKSTRLGLQNFEPARAVCILPVLTMRKGRQFY